MKLSVLLLGSALFCSISAAQSVTVRGKVEDVGANQFVIDCTNTTLVSATFNLNLFVGQEVLLTGAWNGSTAAPSINVQTIVNSIGGFEIPSNPKIGGTLRLGQTGTPGDAVFFLASAASGFLPIGADNTLLLDPATAFRAGSGVIPALGVLETSINLPNDPSLLGVIAHGQAAVFSSGFTVLTLTNPDCKEIKS